MIVGRSGRRVESGKATGDDVARCPGRSRAENGPARGLVAALVVWLTIILAPIPVAGQILPSDADWRSFETAHFRVSFTEGLDELAYRAAARAEWAWHLLAEQLLPPPDDPIELVVVDNVDMSNGMATATPWNRIVVYGHPPARDADLAYHDDWLEMLILHELVHAFHLDQAGGVWRLLRGVFGRNPALYPHYLTPSWLVEGLATYIESAETGAGRVRASVFDMALRTAVLEGQFPDIDRVTLDPIAWPGGLTRYIYGSMFVDELARLYGTDAVAGIVENFGGRVIPFRLDASARAALGTTLSDAWEVWADSLEYRYATAAAEVSAAGVTRPTILSTEGYVASFPRFSPVDGSIAYMASTGRDESALVVLDGSGARREVGPVTQFGPPAWTPDGREIVYSWLDFVGPNDVESDLRQTTLEGERTWLTRRARLSEPDVHPDGSRVVAVRSGGGTNSLVDFDPRWSPDGSRIAAARWRDGDFDIVVLDGAGSVIRQITSDRAVDLNPSWSPDGRYVLFASDRSGIFNLYAFDSTEGELLQVTNVLTGAFQPDVSRDGSWIAFSYYLGDGYHIARIPFNPAGWRTAPPPLERVPSGVGDRYAAAVEASPVRRYSAFPSVLPSAWTPILGDYDRLGVGLGASVRGVDVASRHLWWTSVRTYPSGGRWDAEAAYRYRGRGNPITDVVARQEWLTQRSVDDGPALLRRDREIEISAQWTRRRVRSISWIGTGVDGRKTSLTWSGEGSDTLAAPVTIPFDYGGRLSVGVTTVRGYGQSLGEQEGASVTARLEGRRRTGNTNGDRDYWRLRVASRAFQGADWFGFAPSVFAFRLDAGIEAARTTIGFTAGGGGGPGPDSGDRAPVVGGTRYDVRGYGAGTQGGNRVVAGSLEWRFPIALIEKGYRLTPVALDRLWGDVFLDAGTAWCPETCAALADRVPTRPTPLVSVGAEAILQVRLGYSLSVPVRLGVAVPLRETSDSAPQVYLRTSRSF
jgi:hypothetical protein